MSRMAAVLARSEAQISKQLGHDRGSADPYAKLIVEISNCDATDSRKIAVVILAWVTMNGAVNTRLPVEASRGANLARHRRQNGKLSSFALALSLGFPLSFPLAFTLRFSLVSILKRSCRCKSERELLASIGVIIVIITLRPIRTLGTWSTTSKVRDQWCRAKRVGVMQVGEHLTGGRFRRL